jgi:hypothetical protein
MSTFARKRISHDRDLPGDKSLREILALLPWLWRLVGVTWSVFELVDGTGATFQDLAARPSL